MNKTKTKSKTVKLPKPIKIKKEKSDEDRLPQSMTHYIDDRLEMVKQIFNTLKPKTIVNLAPDYLKTQALEEIEEACLNELLCISTKRLKSIITATKCPTDTESSDNDSDVERHDEHISLEEISSDSEIGGSTSKKAKKKRALKTATEIENGKNNAANQGDGQISVLELLELQARARAIRSQLALEPVTKIEVDSDEEKRKEKEKNTTSKRDDKTKKNERKRFSSETESRDSGKLSRTNDLVGSCSVRLQTEKPEEKPNAKKVTLKRNYRASANNEMEENNHEEEVNELKTIENVRNGKVISSEKALEKEKSKVKETLLTNIKKEKNCRSPSPDVIPIVAVPETLLIADSSDEEKNSKSQKTSVEKACEEETVPTQLERNLCEKESEKAENNQESQPEKNQSDPLPSTEDNVGNKNSNENIQTPQGAKSNEKETSHKTKQPKLSSKDKPKLNDATSSANHSDDDRNDDVISLGGDLENEMNEQLENEVNAMQSPYYKKPAVDSSQDNNKSQDDSQHEDVISLESSEDERPVDNQSWHSRYMKSSKVSKVLAASRLSKRVRDNIKKTKHSKKTTSHENSDAEKEKSTPVFSSKHEDGSVEQYKELLEIRQRKSS